MIIDGWIGEDLEGSDCDLILRYFSGIRPEGPRKPTKNLRIAGLRAEILTRDLSTNQEC
jgi:hypothetical protein